MFYATVAVTAAGTNGTGITDLEVQEIAQMSNPSWVSKEQLARLEPLLEEWPEPVEPEEEITVSGGGAGFGKPLQNLLVEEAAMDAVIDYYGKEWRHNDLSADKVGWDITFTHKQSREVYRVEVKGVTGGRPIVLLTTNEIRAAEEGVGCRQAIRLQGGPHIDAPSGQPASCFVALALSCGYEPRGQRSSCHQAAVVGVLRHGRTSRRVQTAPPGGHTARRTPSMIRASAAHERRSRCRPTRTSR
jgi:hypothetical protein